MKKTILITGGAGFIGSFLARKLLLNGFNVIAIDNFSDYYPKQAKDFNLDLTRASINQKITNSNESEITPILKLFKQYYTEIKFNSSETGNFQFFKIDIRDKDSLIKLFKSQNISIIVHLAAMAGIELSVKKPYLYTDVNIMGSINILNMAKEFNIEKIIFGSSSSIYGSRKNVPFKESDSVDHPVSPYAATKRMQEIMNYTYHYLYNISIINLRIFGPIYGPLQRPFRMLAQRFINQTYHNKPMTIYGNGHEGGRDTTYIDDEIEGIFKAIKSNIKFDTINICTGQVVTPSQVAKEIKKIMGKGKIIYLDRPKSEVPITFGSTKKAENLLNFKAKWNFFDGLQRQIETFLKMPDWYKNMKC